MRALLRRCGIPALNPLPCSLENRTVWALHAALDVEDAIVARYREALAADALCGVYARAARAHAVLSVLDFPDRI
jgi:hypothetical protein